MSSTGLGAPPRRRATFGISLREPIGETAFTFAYRVLSSVIAFAFAASITLVAGALTGWSMSHGMQIALGIIIALSISTSEYLRIVTYERYREKVERRVRRELVELLIMVSATGEPSDAVAVSRFTRGQRQKRILDIVVATLGLAALAPMLASLSLLVKFTSPGPIFQLKERRGLGGEPYWEFVFRTTSYEGETASTVGRWLYRTGLFALPSLFNVLRGDMSLVGPSPAAYPDSKLAVYARPGLTGLVQISGRAHTLDRITRRAAEDAYIRQWSLRLDLNILLRTIPAVLSEVR